MSTSISTTSAISTESRALSLSFESRASSISTSSYKWWPPLFHNALAENSNSTHHASQTYFGYTRQCETDVFYDIDIFDCECAGANVSRISNIHQAECQKNPGHYAYFPLVSLTLNQIPARTRDPYTIIFLKSCGDLTVRIVVNHTSDKRPSEDFQRCSRLRTPRLGTGFVRFIVADEENNTKSRTLEKSVLNKFRTTVRELIDSRIKNKPVTILIESSRHLVYDHEEAVQTVVEFFYDTPDRRGVVKLTAQTVWFNTTHGDSSILLECKCSDVNLVRRLQQSQSTMLESAHKLPVRTQESMTKKLFVVHHPHGGEKVLSYGDCVMVKYLLNEDSSSGQPKFTKLQAQQTVPSDLSKYRKAYLYAADTCMGSSGAPIISFKQVSNEEGSFELDIMNHYGVEKSNSLGASSFRPCTAEDFQHITQTTSPEEDSDDEHTDGGQTVESPVFKVATQTTYPDYVAYRLRLESFTGKWAYNDIIQPKSLALAGFFYAGYADCVRCFQCGLGLRSWKKGDSIYEEHTKHRSECPFLTLRIKDGKHLAEEESAEDIETLDASTNQLNTMSELKVLQSEHQKLKEYMTCRVCNSSEVKDLFLPCGELYACSDCSKLLTHCPSCHKQILATVTVYFT